jgi:hypothetical protein
VRKRRGQGQETQGVAWVKEIRGGEWRWRRDGDLLRVTRAVTAVSVSASTAAA